MRQIRDKVERNICHLIEEFRRYPEKFLTEEDARSYLYSLLFNDFGQIETCEDATISIPLHCEVRWYGKGKLKLRSDIVLIDVSTLRTTETPFFRLPSKGYGFNKPRAIIEIKLRRRGRTSDNKFLRSISDDRQKLLDIRSQIEAEFVSYLIVLDKKKDLELPRQSTFNHKEYYVFPYRNSFPSANQEDKHGDR